MAKTKQRLSYTAGNIYYNKKKIGSFMRVAGKYHVNFTKLDMGGYSYVGSRELETDAKNLAEDAFSKYLKSNN